MKLAIVIFVFLLMGFLSFLYVVVNSARLEENKTLIEANKVTLEENNKILRDIKDAIRSQEQP